MHLMRESWTDSRLDDFAANTDRRFDAVDRRFDAVDKRFDAVDRRFEVIDRRFEAVDRRFDAVDAELQRLNGRFDDLHRTLLQVGGGVVVALIGLIVTQL